MSSVWTTLLKFALSLAITAVSQIKPEQWASLSTIITTWLQNLQNVLPKGNPMFAAFHNYRAPLSKMEPPKPNDVDLWAN
jgi:hypothetical protein